MRQKITNKRQISWILTLSNTNDNRSELSSEDNVYTKLARYMNMDEDGFLHGIVGVNLTDAPDALTQIREICSVKDIESMEMYRYSSTKNMPIIFSSEIIECLKDWDGVTVTPEIEDVFVHLKAPFTAQDTSRFRNARCVECLASPDLVDTYDVYILNRNILVKEETLDLYIRDRFKLTFNQGYFLPRRVIIAGSRLYETDPKYPEKYHNMRDIMLEKIKSLNLDPDKDFIVSGTAEGADKMGEKIAKEMGIKVLRYPANWKKFGKAAGYKRNYEMGILSTEAIIFWDGVSKGSKSMADIMFNLKKPYEIININPK